MRRGRGARHLRDSFRGRRGALLVAPRQSGGGGEGGILPERVDGRPRCGKNLRGGRRPHDRHCVAVR